MTTQTEITQKNHRRAVRFFWGVLIGATLVSLVGNITHAVLPYIPHVVIQIGAAAVPPIALLAAVHGIALAVRAGASGRVYCWAVGAVAAIGVGAFAVSFLALRDARHRLQTYNCVYFPGDHRHGGGRQHPDAGCTRRQTGTPQPHWEGIPQYRLSDSATLATRSDPGGKNRRQTAFAEQHVGTGLCIATTPPGTNGAGLGTSRSDAGRCKPCVGSDCIGGDHTAGRDCGCSALITPWWCINQRCRQGVGDQLQDGTADSGGCRRAPTVATRGGRLTVSAPWNSTPVGAADAGDHRLHRHPNRFCAE